MKHLLACVFLVFSSAAFAGQTSFAPPNDLKIYQSTNIEADAISHASFNRAIDLVYNYYGPIVQKKGYVLDFNRAWSDGTVNSDTTVIGRHWVINSYGGLARYKGMNTVAAYAEVACHELGHHMGGSPYFSDSSRWPGGGPSVEGQSDYWAINCMKAIGFTTKQILAANLSLARVLASLDDEARPYRPGPILPDVDVTNEDHPAAQCRLNTYDASLAGNARPGCWYAGNTLETVDYSD